jgi:Rrf2 family protein
MTISTRSRYGLRLLIELAGRQGQGPVDLGAIARIQEIPEKYLSKLVIPLKGAGLLRSVRGSKGGYELGRAPSRIGLLEVVEALEGGISLLDCTGRPELCSRTQICPTRSVWVGLEEAMRSYLRGINLEDISGSLAPEYII